MSDRQRVYRIQHESREHGPYQNHNSRMSKKSRVLSTMLSNAHNESVEHPALHTWEDTDRIGMNDLNALMRWFKGFHKKLERAGYVVMVFMADVECTLHGQVSFNIETAEQMETMKIRDAIERLTLP